LSQLWLHAKVDAPSLLESFDVETIRVRQSCRPGPPNINIERSLIFASGNTTQDGSSYGGKMGCRRGCRGKGTAGLIPFIGGEGNQADVGKYLLSGACSEHVDAGLSHFPNNFHVMQAPAAATLG
jgi:hypothetical protein